jgi:chromosomal replication initiation ATPase DnaA
LTGRVPMPAGDMRQLALALPLDPGFGEEDFLVSASNAAAHGLVDQWPAWPSRAVIITGPPASGKSHLAAIFAGRSAGQIIAARALTARDVPALAVAGAVAVESVDRGLFDEEALFHLINHMQEQRGTLLLTARTLPTSWAIAMPDLASRLRRMPLASIAQPDDDLIRAVLVKLFADRQIGVEPALIDYLLPRLERSFGAIRNAVEHLDREALARGRRVSRSFAAEVLG